MKYIDRPTLTSGAHRYRTIPIHVRPCHSRRAGDCAHHKSTQEEERGALQSSPSRSRGGGEGHALLADRWRHLRSTCGGGCSLTLRGGEALVALVAVLRPATLGVPVNGAGQAPVLAVLVLRAR